jgi:hypothetical protein
MTYWNHLTDFIASEMPAKSFYYSRSLMNITCSRSLWDPVVVEDLDAGFNKAVSTAQQSVNERLKDPNYNQLRIPVKANALDLRSVDLLGWWWLLVEDTFHGRSETSTLRSGEIRQQCGFIDDRVLRDSRQRYKLQPGPHVKKETNFGDISDILQIC